MDVATTEFNQSQRTCHVLEPRPDISWEKWCNDENTKSWQKFDDMFRNFEEHKQTS